MYTVARVSRCVQAREIQFSLSVGSHHPTNRQNFHYSANPCIMVSCNGFQREKKEKKKKEKEKMTNFKSDNHFNHGWKNTGSYTWQSIVTHFFTFSLAVLPVTFPSRLKVDRARAHTHIHACMQTCVRYASVRCRGSVHADYTQWPRVETHEHAGERTHARVSTCEGLWSLHLESFPVADDFLLRITDERNSLAILAA